MSDTLGVEGPFGTQAARRLLHGVNWFKVSSCPDIRSPCAQIGSGTECSTAREFARWQHQ